MFLSLSLTEPMLLHHSQEDHLLESFLFDGTSWRSLLPKGRSPKDQQCQVVSASFTELSVSLLYALSAFSSAAPGFVQYGISWAVDMERQMQAARCLGVSPCCFSSTPEIPQGVQLLTISFVPSCTCFRDCWRL